MKIVRVRALEARVPIDEPLAGVRPPTGAMREFVVVTIATSDGIEGIGVTFFGGVLNEALRVVVQCFGDLIVGEDPLRIDAILAKLQNAGASPGPEGIVTLALTAIDTALWDIKGKALGLPLATLLGARRDRVPVYASGALTREMPLEDVVRSAAALVKNGFRSMKTQLALPGKTSPEIEVERIRRIRAEIGPDIALMCDINQGWTVAQAISIGSRLDEYHLDWLEDVTTRDDYPGLARVTDRLSTPIAGGEYVYGITPFRHMLEARSVDIAMIDLARVGGVTQWMKVAGMAEAFNVPVVSHLIPEIHVHLIAAARNGLIVEYMPWTRHLFDDPPAPVNGELTVPAAPGLGLRFSKEIAAQFAAAG